MVVLVLSENTQGLIVPTQPPCGSSQPTNPVKLPGVGFRVTLLPHGTESEQSGSQAEPFAVSVPTALSTSTRLPANVLVGAPPVGAPPVGAPPVGAPPVAAPPVAVPLVAAPPVAAPPDPAPPTLVTDVPPPVVAAAVPPVPFELLLAVALVPPLAFGPVPPV